jgi:thiamine biosynthesis lipoprotein
MQIITYAWLLGAVVAAGAPTGDPPLKRYQSAQLHMGTLISIVLYAKDEATANRGFHAAFARIGLLDKIMSDYDPDSELSRLSSKSPMTCGVAVSEDLWRVLEASQSLSLKSNGAFDVTVGPLTKLWRRARRQKEPPSPSRLATARAAVGYQHLRLDPDRHTLQLMRPGMRLDLGAIAKGYATDEALAVLRRLGLPRALVNASGGISAGAPPPGRDGWRVAVAPLEPDAPPSQFLRVVNGAVATSGDTWQFVEIDGKRYSHIIDPRTGWGLTTHSSVTD